MRTCRTCAPWVKVSAATSAIQGFGKVGRGAARFLAASGVRVIAISDVGGAILNRDGIDVEALGAHADLHGTVAGFPGAAELESDLLLESDVDVLVPAAVDGVIHEANADRLACRIVVEGANGPTTPAADRILSDRGVLVVPDILANAGGVVVSYFEWVQANQAYWWSDDEVDARLAQRMDSAWHQAIDRARRDQVSLRNAAMCIAVERVAEAHLRRGLYP